MKAIAKKINDKEWIAEQRNPYYPYEGHKNHPIISTSDIEWLEKNDMNGKEVEGHLLVLSEDGGEHFELKYPTPPIHSDPAGEDIGYYKVQLESHGRVIRKLMDEIEDLKALKSLPPQGGRMFSEGEVLSILSWVGGPADEPRQLLDEYLKSKHSK